MWYPGSGVVLDRLDFLLTFISSCEVENIYLSHDVTSDSDITPCNKIDKPLVV